MSSSLDNLSNEERRDWRALEERLNQECGKLTISQRELAPVFNLSPASMKRRLDKFVSEGLIRVTVEGVGRFAKTIIELTDYQPPNQLLKDVPPILSPVVGVLSLDSPFYLEREADRTYRQVFETSRSSRAFIRLKGIRHSGKSSLLTRLRTWLEREKGHSVGWVDLNSASFTPDAFKNLETFFRQFTYAVMMAFKPYLRKANPPDLKESWRSDLTPGINCDNYLTDVFSQLPSPATLLIDGLDRILGHGATQTPFCNFLRTWNEQKMKNVGQGNIIWPHVVMAYSTEPYPAHSIIGSVFQNVGIEINLSEFTQEQVTHLAALYQLTNWHEIQSQELMNLVGGHPALIQESLFYFYKDRNLKTQDLLGLRLGHDFFQNYLLEKMQLLQPDKPNPLLACFRAVLAGEECRDEYAKFQLEKAGLIKLRDGKVDVLALHREYFIRVL